MVSSNPYYRRNRVAGYFRYQTIPRGTEFENSYFVKICGKTLNILHRKKRIDAADSASIRPKLPLEMSDSDVLKSSSLKGDKSLNNQSFPQQITPRSTGGLQGQFLS